MISIYDKTRTRVSTGKLNNWLHDIKKVHKMPNKGLKLLSIKVIYQISSNPPTFVLFVNDSELVSDSFSSFLKRKLA